MIPDVVAHLWQSTLFAGAAWLGARALRTNRAHLRYWVWFTGSMKFLIPFSLLVGLGALVPKRGAAPPIRTEWVGAIQELGQPLTLPKVAAAAVTSHRDLAAIAFGLWACGFAAVAVCWLLQWRRMQALRNSARAIRVATSLPIPVPVMSASELIEPGVFGILRPVLLLPEDIADRLNQPQLDAILAHELCHIRRRDNLAAAFHMFVQAVFWFHPLVWWIGARLLHERERACDEEVLRLGCEPGIYAAGILAICRLYVSSRLACVSGVTGAGLKQRIESIMKNRSVAELTPSKKLALAAAAAAALIVPVVTGMLNAPAIRAQTADWQAAAGGKMAFEVASVKLSKGAFVPPNVPLNAGEAYRPTGGRFRADFPLWTYIQFAYKIAPAEDQSRQTLARLPKWAATDRYSIEARAPGNPSKDQMRLMVQSLLAERFQLAAHFETREASVFALALVKPGTLGPNLRLHSAGPACDAAASDAPTPARVILGDAPSGSVTFPPMCDSFALIRKSGGALMLAGYRNATMDMLAASLASVVGQGRPVIDKTGLGGRFDFTLEWAPDSAPSDASAAPSDPLGPTGLQALRDQLGLKLESARGPVQILVIDRVERPSEN